MLSIVFTITYCIQSIQAVPWPRLGRTGTTMGQTWPGLTCDIQQGMVIDCCQWTVQCVDVVAETGDCVTSQDTLVGKIH